MLPVIKIENANMITAGGAFMFTAGLTYLLFEHSITASSQSGRSSQALNPTSRTIMGAQLGVVLLTILVTRSSIANLQAKTGLPLGNQLLGWLCLTASLVLPFIHRIAPNNHYLHRLVVIFLAFSPSFILLSISYEGLFYFFFCGTLLAWVRLEHAIYEHTKSLATPTPTPAMSTISTVGDDTELLPVDLSTSATHRTLMLSDLRTSLFFLFLLQSAFFSTGNIASISSFSLDAVYRLIPIFDPFSQAALLMFKILVPFAIISANLGILNRRLGLKSSALFMVVMAISDVMTIRFFFMVRDEGSWLDIGTTISHFVIGSLMSVFVAGLEPISEVLISGVDVTGEGMVDREVKSSNGKVVNTQNGTVKREERPVID
jgi:phosphatidylinositol glycan class N